MAEQEVDITSEAVEGGATLITLKIHAEVEAADLTKQKGVITKNIQNNKFTTMTDQDRKAHQNRPEQENQEPTLTRTANTNRALSRSLVSIIFNRLPNCMRIVESFRAKTFSSF